MSDVTVDVLGWHERKRTNRNQQPNANWDVIEHQS
jgi:hypothetical protein